MKINEEKIKEHLKLDWWDLVNVGDEITVNYGNEFGNKEDNISGVIEVKGTSKDVDKYLNNPYDPFYNRFYSRTFGEDAEILIFADNFIANGRKKVKLIDTDNKKIKYQYPEYFI